jgi:hypothetical protein
MSSPEDRLVALLEQFRFPGPWAAVQTAAQEYNRACVDRGEAKQMGRATFRDDGTGPTRLDLFAQDAEDKRLRLEALWQPLVELCRLLDERGLFGDLGTPPTAPGDPYTPRERAEKVARILDRVRHEAKAPATPPLWSRGTTLTKLAKLYGVDRRTMKRMLVDGKPRSIKLARQGWQVDLHDVPEAVRRKLEPSIEK